MERKRQTDRYTLREVREAERLTYKDSYKGTKVMYQAPDTNEKLEDILAFRRLLGYVNVHFLTLSEY